MRFIKRFLIQILICVLLAVFMPKWLVNKEFSNIIFTIEGILFSVALSLIFSFNLSEIGNDTFYKQVSNALKKLHADFVVQFIICSVFSFLLNIFVLNDKFKENRYIILLISFCFYGLIISFIFFIIKYFAIYNRKKEIEDSLHEERKGNR